MILEGWDALRSTDGLAEKVGLSPEEKAKQIQLNIDFAKTFETVYGKRVLEYFIKNTIDQPTWFPGSASSHAEWREGQNTIIREILQRIKAAENTEE